MFIYYAYAQPPPRLLFQDVFHASCCVSSLTRNDDATIKFQNIKFDVIKTKYITDQIKLRQLKSRKYQSFG